MINNHPLITILLPTYNCASIIKRTLDSISWADEIIVVDSYSDDSTCNIASEYGAKIFQHEYINSAKQKNWALQFCSNEWIFQIDSDEELEDNSEILIRAAVRNASLNIDCFKMPRKNYVIRKWVKYGGLYPDWEYRLFRKSKGKWWDREVHSCIVVDGIIATLNTPLIHHGMPNISKQLENLDRYTGYEVKQYKKVGKGFSYFSWLMGPPYIFFRRYVLQFGFRDGWRGFFLAIYSAIYLFISFSKLLESEILESRKK